ncbi:hypothetical protein ACWDE9_10690, partial [Streptomyces olivaceoviridis]
MTARAGRGHHDGPPRGGGPPDRHGGRPLREQVGQQLSPQPSFHVYGGAFAGYLQGGHDGRVLDGPSGFSTSTTPVVGRSASGGRGA